MKSGLGWAPEIPDHWSVVPLNYVAKMGTGHTPDRKKAEYWEGCTIPWVTIRDATRDPDSLMPLTDTGQKISELGMANSAAVLHPTGTVMLSRTASIGFSVLADRPMATSQDFATWSPGPKLDGRYLLLVLRAMKPEWARLAFGSTHRTIYMPDLEALRIPLPPIGEQRAIADYLRDEAALIDALVSSRRAQQDLLAERYRSAMDEIYSSTGSVRVRLKDLLKAKPRYGVLVPEFVDEGVPLIRVNDLLNLAGRASTLRMIPRSLSSYFATTVVRPRDVLVSVVGTLGRSTVATPEVVGSNVNRAIAVLRVKVDVDPELVSAWMGTTEFLTQASLATGSDSAQATLGMEDLGRFELSWPDGPEAQGEALQKVEALRVTNDSLRSSLGGQLDLLAERRQALITAAVTGQIEVSTVRGVAV